MTILFRCELEDEEDVRISTKSVEFSFELLFPEQHPPRRLVCGTVSGCSFRDMNFCFFQKKNGKF